MNALLTAVILHLELLKACDITTLQIAIYIQLKKYDLCIPIGLPKSSAYYIQLTLAYFLVNYRKEAMYITRELVRQSTARLAIGRNDRW
jgi:hypothetical protein